ncbi:hypothetical protein G4B88_009045 [Cannabis sativa]|uniref:CW-type domain-containing protein n=1 Tax=Cannabis sativa TaxID=3483 RepID=A0A7J6HR49_CANSA|nr:hypothetical protein G4B88_009045 [Cannabis sativa]
MTANGCEEEKLLNPLTMNKSKPLKLYNYGISLSSENLISSATATVFAETFQVESGTKVEIPSSVVGSNNGDQDFPLCNAWVRCDNCHKWRCIPSKDADTIEEIKCTWICKNNMDEAFADCSIPQEKFMECHWSMTRKEENLFCLFKKDCGTHIKCIGIFNVILKTIYFHIRVITLSGYFFSTPVLGKSTAIENSFANSMHWLLLAFLGSLSAKTVCAFAIMPKLSFTM